MPRRSLSPLLTLSLLLPATAACSPTEGRGSLSDEAGSAGEAGETGETSAPGSEADTGPSPGTTGGSDPDSGSSGDSEGADTSSGDPPVEPPSYESIRNNDPLFVQHADAPKDEIDMLGFFHDDFTEVVGSVDNGPGPGGQGQFRVGCQYSHFGLDDPIVFPDQPGAAHLHMFWGNTGADAFTDFSPTSGAGDETDVRQRGGGTCQGFELNRSAYWVPALLDRSGSGPNIVVPDTIILYYKSHRPAEVNPLPPGVELLAGNIGPDGSFGTSFDHGERLFWSCGGNGFAYNHQATIPTDCAAGDPINASIQFPQCLAVDGAGAPVLGSDNHVDHAVFVNNNDPCPASHPYRVPQISYLLYYPNGSDGAGAGVDQWILSSDADVPGGSLHGDWLGGWNDETIERWVDGCFDPSGTFSGPRNCSLGQTGQNGSGRGLRRVSTLNDYTGENFLTDPWPDHSAGHHDHG